jgi:uncharacterized protein
MISGKEQKKLGELLSLADEQSGSVFTLSELLGYLYGLAITPEVIMPSEWLPKIFEGELPEFISEKQAQSYIDTLFRVLNKFSTAFHNGELVFPYDVKDPEGWDIEEVEEWTWGFQKALLLRPECWLREEIPFLSDEEGKEIMTCLAVITAIAEPESAGELFETTPNLAEKSAKFWASLFTLLPAVVESLQHHAARREKERQANLRERAQVGRPVRSEKIGRNDPCPCGSGKKYKKCCLKGEKIVPIH